MIWNALPHKEHGKVVGEIVAVVKEEVIGLYEDMSVETLQTQKSCVRNHLRGIDLL